MVRGDALRNFLKLHAGVVYTHALTCVSYMPSHPAEPPCRATLPGHPAEPPMEDLNSLNSQYSH